MKYLQNIHASVLSLMMMLTMVSIDGFSQAKMRKLPSTLNHPSYNSYAPYLSADANAIVYLTDNAEDNVLTPFYSFRSTSDWNEPQPFPKSVYSRLNSVRSFALSADGKKLFYSTLKAPSVGGFDLWTSEWKGSGWAEPTNIALPVNSPAHEGAPSIASDGSTLFFMRCDKMDQEKAQGCKLFSVSKKQNGQWGEPMELPSSINTGNSQSPRIMADGQTLIFSSDKISPNRGGMDLYESKFVNGTWSSPVPLDFVNTERDDQYVSVSALGRYLVRDEKGLRKNELVEYLIPDNLRPKGMTKIDGKVTDATGAPIPAYVSILNLTSNARVFSGRPYADGSFIVYIMEGNKYELAIDPEKDNATFFSKQFDLMIDKIPQVERVTAVLKTVEVGDEIVLEGLKFARESGNVDPATSASQLRKLLRTIKGNPQLKFEIQVLMTGYRQDSIQSEPDLTEVVYDTTRTTFDEIDTLGQVYQKDTLFVRTTFHNDRTWKQSESIVNTLISQGADPASLSFFGNAIPAALPDEKKMIVKAVARRR
jgi:hypothetical protein